MRNANFVRLLVGCFVLAVVTSLGAAWVRAQQPLSAIAGPAANPARVAGTDIGRFQVVNGTPGQAANIMLLDTVTGDSWVTCLSASAGLMWCREPRSDDTTGPRK